MTVDTHPSTHPPLPPTTEDDLVLSLRLLRSRRVGPSTFYRLLAEHGSVQASLDVLPEIAQSAGIKGHKPCPHSVAQAEFDAGMALGARLISLSCPEYPSDLKEIPDAPPLLWALGNITVLQRDVVALVGARNASSLGTRMARALAAELGEKGYVVASGLARGVDTAAHHATLETGTIAVMAGGVDVMYPAENTALARDILTNGVRLSEQPIGMTPRSRDFPRRNRIISGLSQAVVVVEAAAKSGSLITARNALDQGREVLAVPGHPFDARASGCNLLIRDGARLVRSAEDVIEALPERQPVEIQPQLPLEDNTSKQPQPRCNQAINALHDQILDRLGPSPVAEDQLIRDLAISAHDVTPALVDLELDGRIRRHPGGLLALNA